MSTIDPDRPLQLSFVFLIVIFIVNATPVLSNRISDLTSDDGDLVGKGPAVSVGDTVQDPELVPVPVSVPVVVPVPEVELRSSFLQAASITGTDVAPIRKLLRNFFLDCSMVFLLFCD